VLSSHRGAVARGMVVLSLLAAASTSLLPGTVLAGSSSSMAALQTAHGAESTTRHVARRMSLPKHERTIAAPRTVAPRSPLAAPTTSPPTAVGQITNVSNDQANVYSETAIAPNPMNASQFMALSNVPTQSYMAAFNTIDGGSTWSHSHITAPSAVVPAPILASDPSLVFWGTNADAASFIAADSDFNTYGFVEVGSTSGTFGPYSQCGGFQNGCIQFGNQPDKPFMTEDPRGGGIFDLTWDDNPANAPGSQPLMLDVINGTSGGGLVWDSGGDIGGYPAAMPNGTMAPTIYLAWLDYCGNTPTTVSSQCSTPNGRILIVKTTDDGLHFTRLDGTAVDVNCTIANVATCGPSKITDLTTGAGSILPNYGGSCAMGCSPRLVSSLPSMDIDHSGGTHNGRIYVVWADGASAQNGTSTVPSATRMHIFLSSFDPGLSTTWSTPIRIDSGNTNDGWQPSVAVDQSNGSVAVTWYDRRDDINNTLYRPYYAQSADGGATWSAQIPLSPNTSDPRIDCNGTGDYMQVIAGGGHAHAAWTEMSGLRPQVWVANVDEATVPASFSSTTATGNLRNPSGTSWAQLPGLARDIGVGPDSGCTAAVIGTNSLGGGGGVYVWTGAQWVGPVAGGSGARITVSAGGLPRVVNKNNAIYRMLISNTGALFWSALPGLGSDIASGADGSLWVIGTNAVPGGGGVWLYTGSWVQPFGGGGTRIAVDPLGQPWVINSSHQIFCHNPSGWQLLPGAGIDVGVGANGEVWVIGTNAVPGGFGIFRWSGTCAAGGSWSLVPGGAVAISVGTDGLPFVVNNQGLIFERMF
jgi:Tectonin domain